jgi:hypothetical protein
VAERHDGHSDDEHGPKQTPKLANMVAVASVVHGPVVRSAVVHVTGLLHCARLHIRVIGAAVCAVVQVGLGHFSLDTE